MLKTKKFRRLLAGLLAVLMLSVCLPVGAFATGGEEKVEVTISSVYKDNGEVLREEKPFNVTYVDGQELPEYEGLKDFFGNIDGKAEYAGTYDSTLIMSNGTELSTSTYGPETGKGNNTLVTGYKMKVVVYFNRVEEEPAPEEPTTADVEVKLYRGNNELFTNFVAKNLTIGQSYTLEELAKAADNYALPKGWVEANPQEYTIKAGVPELHIEMVAETTPEEPTTADVEVKLYRGNNELFTNFVAKNLTIGQSYTLEELAKAADNYALPKGWVEANPQEYTIKAGVPELHIEMVAETTPEEPTTADVEVKLYRGNNELFTNFVAKNLTIGQSYTLEELAKAADNYALPKGWVEANPQEYTIKAGVFELAISMVKEAVDPVPQSADYTFTFVNERTGETIHDALDVHVEDVAASVDKYVTDLFADVRLDLENDGYKFTGIRNAYNPDDYAQVTSKVVPGGPYEYIVCFTDDAKVEPADYTFTFVDVANGAEIREYLPVHIADVNTSVDKYVLDLVADARRTLEDNGWVYEGIKNAFNPDEYAQDESLIVPGGPYEYIVCFSKPTEAENVTVNFEFVDMAGNAIMAGTSHTVPYSDDVTGTKVVDVIVDETAELANHSYVLDHMTWVYSDGSESSELKDPVVVPDYDNTTIKVYYAQPAHYTFTFVNDETREEIEDVLTVDIADVKTNVDKYVLDLVAEVRRGLEDDGWTYAGIRNAYNDEEFAQNESLVVPGGPYEYLVCFTKENVEDPTTPSTGDNTTTVTGKDEHPDIAEAKANGTWGAPTATPAAASTIPQTGDSMPVVMLIVIALVAAGAVGGLVVLRKRSHQ